MTATDPLNRHRAYTITDFCRSFGLSRSKVHRLIQMGELAAFKVGRRTLIHADTVEKWLAALPRV
jgi:excisionase family DNA binding protein